MEPHPNCVVSSGVSVVEQLKRLYDCAAESRQLILNKSETFERSTKEVSVCGTDHCIYNSCLTRTSGVHHNCDSATTWLVNCDTLMRATPYGIIFCRKLLASSWMMPNRNCTRPCSTPQITLFYSTDFHTEQRGTTSEQLWGEDCFG